MKDVGIRVYADSSVFGGLFDSEFAAESLTFFEQVRAGRFLLMSSVLVSDELRGAPEPVRTLFDALLPDAELVQVGLAAVTLQSAYLAAGILTQKWADDALHVALEQLTVKCSVSAAA